MTERRRALRALPCCVEARHAELYGATLLGLDVDAYYQALCELQDSIGQSGSGSPPG